MKENRASNHRNQEAHSCAILPRKEGHATKHPPRREKIFGRSMDGAPLVKVVEAPKDHDELHALLERDEAVIVEGLMENWSDAREKMRAAIGDAKLPVRAYQRDKNPFKFETRLLSVDETISSLGGAEERIYMAGPNLLLHEEERVKKAAEEMLAKMFFGKVVEESKDWELGLWIGEDGQHTQGHFDVAHNLLFVLRGRKEVLLAHPRHYLHLYTHNSNSAPSSSSSLRMYRFSQCDFSIPADQQREKFPLFEKCVLQRAVVEEGQALLIPVGHFHDVVSHAAPDFACVAVNSFFPASPQQLARHKWLRMFL